MSDKPSLEPIRDQAERQPSGCRFIDPSTSFSFMLPGTEQWQPDPEADDPSYDWFDRMTQEQMDALGSYMNTLHLDVNSLLRDGQVAPAPHAKTLTEAAQFVKLIDSALAIAPICEDDVAFRGFQSEELWRAAQQGDLVGKVFQDDGFLSLSLDEDKIPYYVCGGSHGHFAHYDETLDEEEQFNAENFPERALEEGLVPHQVHAMINLPAGEFPAMALDDSGEGGEIVLRYGSCFEVLDARIEGATLYLELDYRGIPTHEIELRDRSLEVERSLDEPSPGIGQSV